MRTDAARYRKLDAMRSELSADMFSLPAMFDTLRFFLWMLLGSCADYFLSHCGPDGVFGSIWTATVGYGYLTKIWWILFFGIGGAVSFLERDLQGNISWDTCSNEDHFLERAYTHVLRFAQICCPLQAFWLMVANRSLSRVFGYDFTPSLHGCTARWWVHAVIGRDPDQENPFLPQRRACTREAVVHILSEEVWDDDLQSRDVKRQVVSFIGELDLEPEKLKEGPESDSDRELRVLCAGESDVSEDRMDSIPSLDHGSSDSDTELSEQDSQRQGGPKFFALIYGTHGQFVETSILKSEKRLRLSVGVTDIREKKFYDIAKAHRRRDIVLLRYGQGQGRHKTKPQLYYSHAVLDLKEVRRCCLCCIFCRKTIAWTNILWHMLVLLLVLGLACVVFLWLLGTRKMDEETFTVVSNANLFFLLLPNLVSKNIDIGNWTYGINATSTAQKEEIFKRAAECLYAGDGSHSIRTLLAMMDASLFHLACSYVVLGTCRHMLRGKIQLQELNQCLQPVYFSENHPDVQAMLLYKLHSIRSRVRHKRCLAFVAKYDLPDRLEHPQTLDWWFLLRSAIFQDLQFDMTEKLPLLMIFFAGNMWLVVNTLYLTVHNDPDRWQYMFYSVMLGCVSGSLMLAFFALGHLANRELCYGSNKIKRCIDEEVIKDEEGAAVEPEPTTPSGKSVTVKQIENHVRMHDAVRNSQFHIDYDDHRPLRLAFLGLTFRMRYVWASVSALSTLALPLLWQMAPSIMSEFSGQAK